MLFICYPKCATCQKAKKWLDEHNIEYTERHIVDARVLRMARTEKVIMTNMCMVFSENRVLVQDKTDDDYSGITFPGGHVERGESFTDAVIREVWEETGLKISEPKLCGIKD